MTDGTDEKRPPFEVVAREIVWKGFCTLERVTFDHRTVSGRLNRATFEVEFHGHAGAVLPYDPVRREAVLVRQLRLPQALQGDDPMSLEIIAGLLDKASEDPEETVRREAMEEAGLVLGRLESLGPVRSSPGVFGEKVWIYLAEVDLANARVADGGGLDHEGEAIEVVVLPLADLARLADAGAAVDMKTLCAIQTLRLRRPELFAG
ncbi:NUDIX domain-containing protein [Siculibacillus lacustris]|uniref:GDP-mannose pyrophosphatase n=1 Tax=Siculibacillus lacustris TaxID=1549641 RepID=A0A4Q9VMM5_9HYPH|nr:NUDIX domain-containing protein [Siculibacillus lacustris]TBW35969.1 NUDIX domain-containing protein [Siculibacillus lacustris]